MNKAGSHIYIYIFTLLFIGEDSSALSEISSAFGCGGVGCGTTTEEKVLRMKWSPSRFLKERKWLKTVMMKMIVLDSQVAEEKVEEFGEAEEGGAVTPVNKKKREKR